MSQKKAGILKFCIQVEGELYYQCSENIGADQLCSYCTADPQHCFPIGKSQFSHGEAQLTNQVSYKQKFATLK